MIKNKKVNSKINDLNIYFTPVSRAPVPPWLIPGGPSCGRYTITSVPPPSCPPTVEGTRSTNPLGQQVWPAASQRPHPQRSFLTLTVCNNEPQTNQVLNGASNRNHAQFSFEQQFCDGKPPLEAGMHSRRLPGTECLNLFARWVTVSDGWSFDLVKWTPLLGTPEGEPSQACMNAGALWVIVLVLAGTIPLTGNPELVTAMECDHSYPFIC